MMNWFVARSLFLPTLLWNILLGRLLRLRRWWDAVDPHVLIGALPFWLDVPALRAAGVTAVVNTCEEYAGPVRSYERAGIEQLRIPTVDFNPPTLDHIETAVRFINQHVQQGGAVYVHCKAGRGRSATVVMCWLIDAKKMTPDEAQQLLLKVRPHVNPRVAQREVVRAFYQRRVRDWHERDVGQVF